MCSNAHLPLLYEILLHISGLFSFLSFGFPFSKLFSSNSPFPAVYYQSALQDYCRWSAKGHHRKGEAPVLLWFTIAGNVMVATMSLCEQDENANGVFLRTNRSQIIVCDEGWDCDAISRNWKVNEIKFQAWSHTFSISEEVQSLVADVYKLELYSWENQVSPRGHYNKAISGDLRATDTL